MTHDIFVSYSSKDKAIADAMVAMLERYGVRCWIAPRNVLPGQNWGEAIVDAISGSKMMVLVFSDNSNSSPQVEREVERAVNAGVHIIPFRIDGVLPSKAMQYFVSTPHWLDAMKGPMDQHLRRLTAVIKKVLSVSGETAAGHEAFSELSRPAGSSGRRLVTSALIAILLMGGGAVTWAIYGHRIQSFLAKPPAQAIATTQPAPITRAAMAIRSTSIAANQPGAASPKPTTQSTSAAGSTAPTVPASAIRIDHEGHRVIDLMALIDVPRDRVAGIWTADANGGLTTDSPRAVLRIPYVPPDEYDFRVEFIRNVGHEAVRGLLSVKNHRFTWAMGGHDNSTFAFDAISGNEMRQSVATIKRQNAIVNGRIYRSNVTVRKDFLASYLDHDLLTRFKTDFTDLSVPEEFDLGTNELGIGSSEGSTTFRKIEITEIVGSGHVPAPIPVDERQVTVLDKNTGPITALGYASDGRLMCVSRFETQVWHSLHKHIIMQHRPGGDANLVALSADGNLMLLNEQALGECCREILSGGTNLWHGEKVVCAALSPDGTRTALGRITGHTAVVETKTHKILHVFMNDTGDLTRRLVFSPDGNFLLKAGSINSMLFNLTTAPNPGPAPAATWAAFSPEGGRMLLGSEKESTVRLINTSTGQTLATVDNARLVKSAAGAFVLGGKQFVTASDTGVILWDIAGKRIRRFPEASDANQIAVSPDGAQLLVADEGGMVRLIDVVTARQLAAFAGHRRAVTTVVFSPNGRRAASGGADRSVRVWQLPPG